MLVKLIMGSGVGSNPPDTGQGGQVSGQTEPPGKNAENTSLAVLGDICKTTPLHFLSSSPILVK